MEKEIFPKTRYRSPFGTALKFQGNANATRTSCNINVGQTIRNTSCKVENLYTNRWIND